MRSLLVLISVLIIASCGIKQSDDVEKKGELKVIYATNYPLYFMTKQMVPPSVAVRFPAFDSIDPSLWKPLPDTIADMQQADLIICNGASYEKWLTKVSLPPSKLVNTSVGFQDQLIEVEMSTTHSHGPQGAHAHAGTAITTWMDLSLAIEQAQAIEQALITLIPESASYVSTQSQELQQKLSDLHHEFMEAGKNFSAGVVYSHPVYQYFQQAYGITGPSLHLEPDQPITNEQVQHLEYLQQQNPIAICIWEANPLPESVNVLESLGIKSLVVNTMGGKYTADDFLAGLKNNLNQLHSLN